MSEHSYPTKVMLGDTARSAAGVILTGLFLFATWAHPVVTPVLGLLALVFAGYGARAAVRHFLVYRVDQRVLETVSRHTGRRLRVAAWDDLERVRLAFFPTRRRRGEGVMELSLAFGRRRTRIDSRIAGFQTLARRAFAAAGARGVSLGARTRDNFAALGIGGDGCGEINAPASRRSWGRPSEWTRSQERDED